MKRILVVGGGFAGLWSAVGAARTLDAFGVGDGAVEITLVDREAHHNIRVRNYEADLRDARVPFDEVLGPIGVKRIEAEVHAMDFVARQVTVATPRGELRLPYDRLVFALRYGQLMIMPVIISLMLATVLWPAVSYLNQNWHLPRAVAGLAVMLTAVCGLGLFVALTAFKLQEQFHGP